MTSPVDGLVWLKKIPAFTVRALTVNPPEYSFAPKLSQNRLAYSREGSGSGAAAHKTALLSLRKQWKA